MLNFKLTHYHSGGGPVPYFADGADLRHAIIVSVEALGGRLIAG